MTTQHEWRDCWKAKCSEATEQDSYKMTAANMEGLPPKTSVG